MSVSYVIPSVDVTPDVAFSASGFTKGLVIYLKTTDTCQLNCDHCFTSGKNGSKVFFDPVKTLEFLKQLYEENPNAPYVNILIHGGEPLLANSDDIIWLWEKSKDLWPNIHWGLQTNLTFKLKPSHHFIISTICKNSLGTSWDNGIRWTTDTQRALWQSNVRMLVDLGADVSVMVSIDRSVASMRPVAILNKLAALGVSSVMFENITNHGHAKSLNTPSNSDIASFFEAMLDDAIEHEYHSYIHNATLADIITSVKTNDGVATHCRDCEQKILTVSATGSVSGCPNSAADYTYGNIAEGLRNVLNSPVRTQRVFHELSVDDRCLSCPYFAMCKGGCHQLEWEGDICPSPKSLFSKIVEMKNEPILEAIRRGPTK